MNTARLLIITGGNIDFLFGTEYLKENKFNHIIAVDKGLEFCSKAGIIPTNIVGDFDSIDTEILDDYQKKYNDQILFHTFDKKKDYTDTHLAINKAVELKPEEIIVMGGIGTRLDHTLANINLLMIPLQQMIPCAIIDPYNKIYLINKNILLKKQHLFGKYLSLHPLTQTVTGVTLKGFKYPLNNHTLKIGESLGISNEIIEPVAKINIKNGILIVIEAKD